MNRREMLAASAAGLAATAFPGQCLPSTSTFELTNAVGGTKTILWNGEEVTGSGSVCKLRGPHKDCDIVYRYLETTDTAGKVHYRKVPDSVFEMYWQMK